MPTLPDLPLWQVIAILGVGWGGFRWLRKQIRDSWNDVEFRKVIREESVEALRTEEGQRQIRSTVADAMTGAVKPLTDAIGDLDKRIAEHGRRIGELERWRAAADQRVTAEFSRMRRLLTSMFRAMKRAGLVKGEDEP